MVGAFYGYMFEFGGDPEFGHNALGRLLRSKHLDFMLVTASYFDRALGSGADYARSPITSVALHGKLWSHGNDTVSFRYEAMKAGRQDRETVARYRRELGVTETAQETTWQYRRIRLPNVSDVCDPFTGTRLYRRVTGFEHEFRAKETVIWRIA